MKVYAQLDTGASRTFVRPKLRGQLRYLGEGRKMMGVFGDDRSELGQIDEMQFLGHVFKKLSVNLSKAERGPEVYSVESAMTLGTDVLFSLMNMGFSLSFSDQTISFTGIQPSGMKKLRITMDRSLAFLGACIDGKNLNALFDTGAGFSALNKRVLNDEGAPKELKCVRELVVTDPVGGNSKVPVFTCDEFSLAGFGYRNIEFLILDFSKIERVSGLQIDFVFGVNLMMNHDWHIFPNARALFVG
jgi:hypothetical protein